MKKKDQLKIELSSEVAAPRFWMAVACKEHVENGVKLGIAQFCHGKVGPSRRISKRDWVIYYSSKLKFDQPEPCQMFTAIGKVIDDMSYQVEMDNGFKPYRRDMKYREANATGIRPLIDVLPFITDKKHWGAVFRYGFLEIDKHSFEIISTHMLGQNPLD